MNAQFKEISNLLALGIFALAVVGCDAKTKVPLCDQAPGSLQAIIGDYEMNDRDMDVQFTEK